MEKILDLVRSNNLVQAVLCIAFGLFLMIYPSITIQGIIMLFGVALALMGAAGLVSYFRQKSVRYRNTGTLMGAVFYLIIALIAFVFPKVIAGFFSVVLGVVLILFAIVNVVRAVGLRSFGSSIWIAVLVAAVIVGVGGVLIVVGRFHDLRAGAGRGLHRQRCRGPVHRMVRPRFRQAGRLDGAAPLRLDGAAPLRSEAAGAREVPDCVPAPSP